MGKNLPYLRHCVALKIIKITRLKIMSWLITSTKRIDLRNYLTIITRDLLQTLYDITRNTRSEQVKIRIKSIPISIERNATSKITNL